MSTQHLLVTPATNAEPRGIISISIHFFKTTVRTAARVPDGPADTHHAHQLFFHRKYLIIAGRSRRLAVRRPPLSSRTIFGTF